MRTVIESKVWIALSAVALTLQTQVQSGLELHWHPYVAVVFFATLLEYNVHRLISVRTHPETPETEKHRWVRDHMPASYAMLAIASSGFVVSLLFMQWLALIILVPLGLVTILYSLPVSNSITGLLQIRKLPYVKIFAISAVWAVTTTALPFMYHHSWMWSTFATFATERFLFVFALTLPFDARDIRTDTATGIATIPTRLGADTAFILARLIVLIFTAWCVVRYGSLGSMHMAAAFLLSGSITIAVLTSQRIMSLPYYYYGFLDGMMLLQGVLVMASAVIATVVA